MKLIIILIPLFFQSLKCISQNTSPSIINPQRISLFDKDIKKKLNENTTQCEIKWKVANIYDGYMNLSSKFSELNSKWISVKNFDDNSRNIIIDISKNPSSVLATKHTPQLINDSLLIFDDGQFKNIYNGENIIQKSGVDKIPFKIKGLNQFKSNNQIIKSDIFYTTFSDSEPNKFVFNLLTDSLFITSEKSLFQGQIINNPNSKYLLFSEKYLSGKTGFFAWNLCLMNRFNVIDRKNIPVLLLDTYDYGQPPIINNDSIIYIGVNVKSSYKLLGLEYNKEMNSSLKEELLYPSNIGDYYSNINTVDYGKYEFINANQISYFFNKYNKVDISKSNIEELNNYYNTFKNTLGYDPYLIIEYNYINQSIVSIIDKPIIPMRSIKSIHLDNSNRFLIVQQSNNEFTIFDLKNKKEVITLSGVVNSINNQNELIVNVLGEYSNFNLIKIQFIKLNLNELQLINDDSYVRELENKLNIDEFTTKSEFEIKTSKYLNQTLVKKNSDTYTIKQKTPYRLYNCDFVINTISSNIKRYYSKVNSTQNEKEMVFNLKYSSYSIERNTINT
jgi:hypothetical protein